MILRALEVRRKATTEIFKETIRKKGKFGITYTTNLASRVPGFIDYVMIEAAALKRLPEFEDLSFDARVKAVLEDSKVVPLIRFEHSHVNIDCCWIQSREGGCLLDV